MCLKYFLLLIFCVFNLHQTQAFEIPVEYNETNSCAQDLPPSESNSFEPIIYSSDIENYFYNGANVKVSLSIKEWILKGFSLAKGLIADAYQNSTKPFYINHYSAMFKANPVIHWPKRGKNFRGCKAKKGTLAFVVNNSPKNIYLCRESINMASLHASSLAQTLVHELVHVIRNTNECHATYLEVFAMRNSQLGLQYKNAYIQNCYK